MDLARAVFSHLCHQDEGRAWVLGGEPLVLCARCTGVYAGAALAALTLPLARFRPGAAILWLHGAAMLQMLVLGFNPFEEPAWLRTLSGAAFSAGAVYFLWLPVRARLWPDKGDILLFRADGPPGKVECPLYRRWPYFVAAAGALALLQVLVRIDLRAAGAALEVLALAGLAAMALLVLSAGVAMFSARRARPA